MRKLISICALFLASGLAFGQGGAHSGEIIKSTSGQPGTVRVCTKAATGTPCAPLASIYSDAELSIPATNPIATDSNGNYTYYAHPGTYKEQFQSGISRFTRSVTIAPDLSEGLLIENINGVLYADADSPTDMGAQINALYASCPTNGCTIHIPAGFYNYTTPIVLDTSNKAVKLECDGHVQPATVLHYYATTGTAVTLANGPGKLIRDCQIKGPSTGTSVGVYITDSVLGGMDGVDISYFDVGLKFGANTYVEHFDRMAIHDNATNNILVPAGLTNFGENISFSNSDIYHPFATTFSTTCISIQSGSNFHFTNTSLDQCGMSLNGNNVHVDLATPHLENSATALPFITIDTDCQWCGVYSSGGWWMENGDGTGRTEFILDKSTVADVDNEVLVLGGLFVPNETVAQLVNSTHACCSSATVMGIVNGFGGFQFTNLIGGNWSNNLAPMAVNSNHKVDNLNVDLLDGKDWASPAAIGTGTPAAATFTTIIANTSIKVGASGSTISDSRELVQSAHTCGTTTTCANTANGSNRMIFGTVALSSGTPSTAVVSSITAFTSTSSFVCTVTDMTAANALSVANTSTSSITITGPNTVTDTVAYQCIGN